MNPLGVLARYTGARERSAVAVARCELCAAPLPEAQRHDHLADLAQQTLVCACRACALLFEKPGAAGGRYRTVPDRVLVDPDLDLSDYDWEVLQIPVRLAFVFRSTPAGRWVAVYPGMAGAMESTLPLDPWEAIVDRSRLLQVMQPDVEALLVHGPRNASLQSFLVPIDVCYALSALVRQHHRSFDGGSRFRGELDRFFAQLRTRSRRFDGGTP